MERWSSARSREGRIMVGSGMKGVDEDGSGRPRLPFAANVPASGFLREQLRLGLVLPGSRDTGTFARLVRDRRDCKNVRSIPVCW